LPMPSRSNKFGSGMHGISCADPQGGSFKRIQPVAKQPLFIAHALSLKLHLAQGCMGLAALIPRRGGFKRIQPVARQPLFIAHALSLKLHLAQGCMGLAALIPKGVASKEFSRLQGNRFLLPMPFRSNCIWLRDAWD